MSWYREFHDEWKEIIETVARELGRTEQIVEKDTIQSMFLFELAKSELPLKILIFSLICGQIRRFAECRVMNIL